MKTKEQKIQEIIDYLNENREIFIDAIEELDGYNGWLGDRRVSPMEELDEFYADCKPLELLDRVYYGHDDDNYTTDERGEKHYGEFCPNRAYFYYNGYGNLVSTDYKDYSDFLDAEFIETLADYAGRIYIDDTELAEMLEALNEDDEVEV